MICNIYSVAFTQDNKSAFISDTTGFIKMIKWKPNANTENDFDFTQNSIQVNKYPTFQICLTRDDKNLLFSSGKRMTVFNIESRNITKDFKLNAFVQGIKLIDGGKSVLIIEENGDLTIINLETMKMSASHKNIANDKKVLTIALI